MSLEIRTLHEDELDAFLGQLSLAFASPRDEAAARRFADLLPMERNHAAWDGGRLIGTMGAFPLRLSVPGGSLACGGVTRVSVRPTHRRQGVLTAMMRVQLDWLHELGEPVAALYASETAIYGRFGYGLATRALDWTLPRARAALRSDVPAGPAVDLVDAAGARTVIDSVAPRVVAATPGAVLRDAAFWDDLAQDRPEWRHGLSELRYAVTEGGFAIFRQQLAWPPPDFSGTVRVGTLFAETPVASAALWRFLLDLDLTDTIAAGSRPLDEPLRLMLRDERALQARVMDGLYLRLVDLAAALEGRGYAVDGRLVLAVGDEICPWNAGTWELEVTEGRAACRRSSREAEITLSAEQLAACHLGGNRFSDYLRAGLLAGTAEACARADAMFAASRQPWCPHHF